MIESDSIHETDSRPACFSNSVRGLAVVNADLWKCSGNDDFNQCLVDDFGLDIQASVSSDSILLVIGENKKAVSWVICSDNFYLGMDDGRNIVNLFLDKVTDE